jgi:preprotein translocase subunit Sss1
MNKIKQWLLNFLKSFKITGLPAIIGFVGAYGGQENKWVRRIGIPLIFTICALIELRSLWVIFLMSIAGWLSCGYGLPDLFEGGDKGSFLGKFWFNILNVWNKPKRRTYADILTRATVGLGIAISFLVIPILKWNWLAYLLGSIGIILVWALVSWQGFGEFKVKLFGKEYKFLKVDFVTYSLTAVCGLFIIYK